MAPPPPRRLDHKALARLLDDVWPGLPLRTLSVEKVHTGRNSDHYRVHHRERSLIVRSAPDDESAGRHIAALEALVDETYAPRLYGHTEHFAKRRLIAMEDVFGKPYTPVQVQEQLPSLLEIVRSVHEHDAFGGSVEEVGLDERALEEPPGWFTTSLARLRELAPADERVVNIQRWLDVAQRRDDTDLINSVFVCAHGDLHRENWLHTSRGPVLIDWEDIGRAPLANELASLIVFGNLEPRSSAEVYGVPSNYVEAVEIASARLALFLYAYWLRKLLEGEDADLEDLAYASALSKRYFG